MKTIKGFGKVRGIDEYDLINFERGEGGGGTRSQIKKRIMEMSEKYLKLEKQLIKMHRLDWSLDWD